MLEGKHELAAAGGGSTPGKSGKRNSNESNACDDGADADEEGEESEKAKKRKLRIPKKRNGSSGSNDAMQTHDGGSNTPVQESIPEAMQHQLPSQNVFQQIRSGVIITFAAFTNGHADMGEDGNKGKKEKAGG